MLGSSSRTPYEMGGYNPQQFGNHPVYPSQQTTSIALFHIPNDATNSLYVDGVPNDTSEREVSRNYCESCQIFFVPFRAFSVSA